MNLSRTYANFFNRPHPFQFDWRSIALPCFLVVVVIVLLAPFGFMRSSWWLRLGFALIFAGIAAGSIVGVMAWRGRLEEEQWTIGKECWLHAQILCTIALLNSLMVWVVMIQWLGYVEWSFAKVLWNVGMGTFSISLLPVGLLIGYEHYQRQRLQLEQAMALNQQLTTALQQPVVAVPVEPICLYSEQGKPVLQLHPAELLFVQSDGNYVEVFYQNDNANVQRLLIRNRLKTILEQLPNTVFFHCHKRYIINQKQIVRVEGNARNIVVFLRGYADAIPISRSKTQALKELLGPS